MNKPIHVAVVGLGPIGVAAAQAVAADASMKLVGLLDIDPAKVGKPLPSLPGSPTVTGRLEDAVRDAQVAIVCTTSKFDALAPMLRDLAARKVHVVSSCEEMSWPRYRHPALADEIDAVAKRAGVAVLGTGVNPGYVMDLLAVQLSSMMMRVSSVRCVRRVDALQRREPLQRKIGSGMTTEQFDALKRENKIGHQGIAESVAMLAAGLGAEARAGSVRVGLEPVLAEREIASAVGPVKPGQVCGMRNTASWAGNGLSIELDLTMALGLGDPHDAIELRGPEGPAFVARIPGSTPGDTATVAALVNTARLLPRVAPGLCTMLDLPAAGARAR